MDKAAAAGRMSPQANYAAEIADGKEGGMPVIRVGDG